MRNEEKEKKSKKSKNWEVNCEMVEKASQVKQMGAIVLPMDGNAAMLHTSTRWDYFRRYIPLWKRFHTQRAQVLGFAFLGLVILPSAPVVSFVLFAAAGYTYSWFELSDQMLNKSSRVVIMPK